MGAADERQLSGDWGHSLVASMMIDASRSLAIDTISESNASHKCEPSSVAKSDEHYMQSQILLVNA